MTPAEKRRVRDAERSARLRRDRYDRHLAGLRVAIVLVVLVGVGLMVAAGLS